MKELQIKNDKTQAQKAFERLVGFSVERTYPLKAVSSEVNGPDAYDDGDNEAPFFTEAFLYNLLGKEDARTLLDRIYRLGESLGVIYF